MNGGHGSTEFGEGSGDPGILGQWIESREDGGRRACARVRRIGAERGTRRRPTAFERARACDRGEKREAGGSGGEDATRHGAGVGPGPDHRRRPDRVLADRGSAAAPASGALCFEQERAAPSR
jgi:hypothetical protein